MDILTIFILPIHENGMSFHLSVFPLTYLCLVEFSVQVFHSLEKFIPKYFGLFDAIVNRIAFLIFLYGLLYNCN